MTGDGIEIPIQFGADFAKLMREYDAFRAQVASNPVNVGVRGGPGGSAGGAGQRSARADSFTSRMASARAANGGPLSTEQIRQILNEDRATKEAARAKYDESRHRQRAMARMNRLNSQTNTSIELDNKTSRIIREQRLQYWRQEANAIRQRISESQGFANLKGMGAMAGLGVAGLAASGFSGTVEGNRFNNELRVLSLELAAAFKPLQESITGVVRSMRKAMQDMTEQEQNQVQALGIAGAGAAAGYKIGGPIGAAAGLVAGPGLQVTKSIYNSGRMLVSGPDQNPTVNDYMAFRDITQTSAEKRQQAIAEKMQAIDTAYNSYIDKYKRASLADRFMGIAGNVLGSGDNVFGDEQLSEPYKRRMMDEYARSRRALEEMKKRTEKGESMDDLFVDQKTNQDRRKVMLTEGTGFYGAGSTWFAIQETAITQMAAESKNQSTLLGRVAAAAEKTAANTGDMKR